MRTDQELLADYAATGSDSAFAELVARHGQMVYRTCLRSLGDEHAAEDAAQATFLVLVRKRRALRSEGELAAWLHRVAKNAAHLAARSRARRERHEEAAAMVRETVRPAEPTQEDRAALAGLDRELDGLPAEQRQAVVLRYLEGRSQEDAAKLAGCPQGTLARRAQLGLERLRERLCQRGDVLAAPGLLALLGAEAGAAAPAALLPSILAASKLAAAGAAAGAAGSGASVLADGVLKMMFWMKVKLAAAVVAGALVVGSAGGVVAGKMLAGEPAGPKPVETGAQEQSLKCQVTALLPGGRVTLSAGAEQGARAGFEFEVSRDGQKVGTVKAVAVEARSLTAELLSATGEIKVGDLAATRFRAVEQPAPKAEWGEESGGLVASLRATKTDFAPGEPMAFEVVVKNNSKLSRQVLAWGKGLSPVPWGLRFNDDWEWRGHVEVSLTSTWVQPGKENSLSLKPGPADQPAFRHVEGNVVAARKTLPEGTYHVQAAYFPRYWDDRASRAWSSNTLATNSLTIRIGAAPAGGEAVNGLKLTISADKLEVKAGEEINVSLNFENVSGEAVHILKFDYLTLDWELAAPDGESLLPAPTAMPGLMPPAAKDYPELKAGGQLAWRGRTISGNPPQVYVGPQANYRNVYLVKPGTYKLTAVYALREGQGQGVAAGKVWAGTVRSNTLELKLAGEFKAPARPAGWPWPPKGIPGVTPPQKGQEASEPAKPAAGAPDEAAARKLAEEWGKAHPAESADWGEFAGIQDQGNRWSVSFKDKLSRGPLIGNPTVFVDKKTGEVTLFKGRH